MLLLPTTLSLLLLCAQPALSSPSPSLLQWTKRQDGDAEAPRSYTDDDAFREAVLNVTNTYRKQHNATALRWNESLAEFAEDWSERCEFEHSGGPSGENLSSGYANASQSIIAWGHERVDYDFEAGEFDKETGHFTQLVWKNTRSVGCGRTECNGDGDGEAPGWFVVCEYYPAGNVLGSFVENVQPQIPADEQDDGPSDPEVPEEEGESEDECPQGGDCSAGGRVVASPVWAAGLAVWVMMWML